MSDSLLEKLSKRLTKATVSEQDVIDFQELGSIDFDAISAAHTDNHASGHTDAPN
jgi:hypothetical protein